MLRMPLPGCRLNCCRLLAWPRAACFAEGKWVVSITDELVQTLLEMSEVRQSQASPGIIAMLQLYLTKFSSLLGPTLVDVTFTRCTDEHRSNFPWLPVIQKTHSRSEILKLLDESFLAHSAYQVDCATRSLLTTHIEMLFGMIGETLTVQFVCNVAAQRSPKG